MLDEGVIVGQSTIIPDETVCSHYTYDSERKRFIHIDDMEDMNFTDELEKGVKAFVPRELQLKEWELMGSSMM